MPEFLRGYSYDTGVFRFKKLAAEYCKITAAVKHGDSVRPLEGIDDFGTGYQPIAGGVSAMGHQLCFYGCNHPVNFSEEEIT